MASVKIYPNGFSETQFKTQSPVPGKYEGFRDGNIFYTVAAKVNKHISSALVPCPIKFQISPEPMAGWGQQICEVHSDGTFTLLNYPVTIYQ
jgi:hypothetical protein